MEEMNQTLIDPSTKFLTRYNNKTANKTNFERYSHRCPTELFEILSLKQNSKSIETFDLSATLREKYSKMNFQLKLDTHTSVKEVIS